MIISPPFLTDAYGNEIFTLEATASPETDAALAQGASEEIPA
jgi:hypothetical protein